MLYLEELKADRDQILLLAAHADDGFRTKFLSLAQEVDIAISEWERETPPDFLVTSMTTSEQPSSSLPNKEPRSSRAGFFIYRDSI